MMVTLQIDAEKLAKVESLLKVKRNDLQEVMQNGNPDQSIKLQYALAIAQVRDLLDFSRFGMLLDPPTSEAFSFPTL
jgi:hypothetical protein